ncbi:MAG: ankyrin repeat domain-containing protein [Geminicoccaceae bacterium]
MAEPVSSPGLDGLSWHDNALYGVGLDVGDCARGDWHADLVLDLDHIVEWLCGVDRQIRFRVAPATLTFHHVTDLQIAIDCGDSGGRIALHALSIDAITRERIRDQKICLDRPYWRWRIALNDPPSAPAASPRSCAPSRCCWSSSSSRPGTGRRSRRRAGRSGVAMHEALAVHDAYERGDLGALKTLLGDPPDFSSCRGPAGVGEIVLEYAIYHSPLAFIRTLLELGADPNYPDHAGFPSLIAALSTDRADRYELVELLLAFGADIQERGINDWTPLHCAAATDDLEAIDLLLRHGADPTARTRIDDCATPLEEAEILGRTEAVRLLRNLAPG